MARSSRNLKRSFKRQQETRKSFDRILIVCEGETEKSYFDDFRIKNRLSKTDIEVVPAGVPRTVVKEAKKRHDKSIKDKDPIKKESIWCVFDRDEHPGYKEAIDLATQYGFGVSYSNPCFELWYIFHFKDQTANIHRHKATKELEYHFPGWNKPGSLYNETLKDQPVAISRAKKGRQLQIENGNPDWENPSTKVDLLVNHLNKAKRDFDGQ